MFIRPLNNWKVRDPFNKDHLPAEGRHVHNQPYWQRRLAEGAIEITTPPAEAPAEEAKPAKTAESKNTKGAEK